MSKKFHRAFGVYGILGDTKTLVVIKKNAGPYVNRFDLPGGSLEDGESLNKAIIREVKEETGLSVEAAQQLGTTSFKYPWHYERWEMNQHICVFYEIQAASGSLLAKVSQFTGQDSLGAVRIPLESLTRDNASPLVLKAKAFLENHRVFDPSDESYDSWEILTKPGDQKM